SPVCVAVRRRGRRATADAGVPCRARRTGAVTRPGHTGPAAGAPRSPLAVETKLLILELTIRDLYRVFITHLIVVDEWGATTARLPGKKPTGRTRRNTHVAEQESGKRADGLHVDRVVGGHRHYCHLDWHAAASRAEGA